MLTSAAVASVVALVSPLLIRALRLPVPDVVVQLLLGIVVGPQLLGLAKVDAPLQVLSLVGLSLLLFLAGLELQMSRLSKRSLGLALGSFGISFTVALLAGQTLQVVHVVDSPLLIAVILSSTALGIVLPVLDDAGLLDRPIGRAVVAGASLAEVVPIVLLSLLFSGEGADPGSQLTLLGAFAGLVAVVVVAALGLERFPWLGRSLLALQSTTAEVRVRAALALLMCFAGLAAAFGLEAILGSFIAGVTISVLDRDENRTHTLFRVKLQAVGFGALIPFFFIATGMALDVRRLTQPETLVRAPIFLVAILLVRGLPAILYRRLLGGWPDTMAAGLLEGTTLSIPIIGGSIGVTLHLIRPENYVALVAASVATVVLFPTVALATVRRGVAR